MEFHFAIFDAELGLVANLTFQKLDDKMLKMRQVAVFKKLQNKGLGIRLVYFGEKWAIRNGYQAIKLNMP
jgi:predicted N-acetyltransferase YhbS